MENRRVGGECGSGAGREEGFDFVVIKGVVVQPIPIGWWSAGVRRRDHHGGVSGGDVWGSVGKYPVRTATGIVLRKDDSGPVLLKILRHFCVWGIVW